MELALPIVIGALCGLLGGAPYAVVLRMIKRSREASVAPLLIAVGASIVVIALSILLAWILAPDVLLEFTIALVVAFLVAVVVSVIVFGRRPRP